MEAKKTSKGHQAIQQAEKANRTVQEAAKALKIEVEELRAKTHKHYVTNRRAIIAMVLCGKYPVLPYKSVAAQVGLADHSAIYAFRKRLERYTQTDPELRELLISTLNKFDLEPRQCFLDIKPLIK